MLGMELIIGAVLPPFIDLINQYIKDSRIRYAISLLVCVLIGVVMNLQQLSLEDILGTASIIFASAQTIYKTYYNESKLRSSLYRDLPE